MKTLPGQDSQLATLFYNRWASLYQEHRVDLSLSKELAGSEIYASRDRYQRLNDALSQQLCHLDTHLIHTSGSTQDASRPRDR